MKKINSYKMLLDTWQDFESLPTGLSSPGVISYGKDIFVLGGYNDGPQKSSDDGISKDILRWSEQKWFTLNDTLNYARAVFTINEWIL